MPADADIMTLLDRAVAALTYDRIDRLDAATLALVARDEDIPLLERSIGQDLDQMERWLGIGAREKTLLSAIAASIRIALVAVDEARAMLARQGGGLSGGG